MYQKSMPNLANLMYAWQFTCEPSAFLGKIEPIGEHFLNQAHAPGFLKLFLCGRLYVCVYVCVSAPEAINN